MTLWKNDPVMVSHKNKRYALFATHSHALEYIRKNPTRFPIKSRIIRLSDGAWLSWIAAPSYLQLPSQAGMTSPTIKSGGVSDSTINDASRIIG